MTQNPRNGIRPDAQQLSCEQSASDTELLDQYAAISTGLTRALGHETTKRKRERASIRKVDFNQLEREDIEVGGFRPLI